MADVSLANLADHLKIRAVRWSIRRNDELSGAGDGRFWQAELAPPLWQADVEISTVRNSIARQVAARIRGLNGARDAFFLWDPVSWFPAADPGGAILGSSTVTILNPAVGDDRSLIRLQGMPAGYVLTVGDKLQVAYSSNPTRYSFHEVADLAGTVTANASGQTTGAGMRIFPHLSVGVEAGDAVTLIRPSARMIVVPGSFDEGTAGPAVTAGMRFQALQKV